MDNDVSTDTTTGTDVKEISSSNIGEKVVRKQLLYPGFASPAISSVTKTENPTSDSEAPTFTVAKPSQSMTQNPQTLASRNFDYQNSLSQADSKNSLGPLVESTDWSDKSDIDEEGDVEDDSGCTIS